MKESTRNNQHCRVAYAILRQNDCSTLSLRIEQMSIRRHLFRFSQITQTRIAYCCGIFLARQTECAMVLRCDVVHSYRCVQQMSAHGTNLFAELFPFLNILVFVILSSVAGVFWESLRVILARRRRCMARFVVLSRRASNPAYSTECKALLLTIY